MCDGGKRFRFPPSFFCSRPHPGRCGGRKSSSASAVLRFLPRRKKVAQPGLEPGTNMLLLPSELLYRACLLFCGAGEPLKVAAQEGFEPSPGYFPAVSFQDCPLIATWVLRHIPQLPMLRSHGGHYASVSVVSRFLYRFQERVPAGIEPAQTAWYQMCRIATPAIFTTMTFGMSGDGARGNVNEL